MLGKKSAYNPSCLGINGTRETAVIGTESGAGPEKMGQMCDIFSRRVGPKKSASTGEAPTGTRKGT